MKLRMILFCTILLAVTSFAARLTITSYGIPHSFSLGENDKIAFDDYGLYATVTTPGAPSPIVRKFYLGYSNKVVLDTVGGPLQKLYVNAADGSQTVVDFSVIDSIVFTPSIDSSGDFDSDGLSTYEELMVYHTDPRKKDSDGDGLDDAWESARNPNVYSPLLSNLPALSISMLTYPKIYLITSTDTSQSSELTVSDGSGWETSEGQTTTNSSTSSLGGMTGVDVCNSQDAGFDIIPKISVKFQVTVRQEFTYGKDQTHEVSSERQASNSKSYEQAVSTANETHKTLTGGKLSVMVQLANTGTIGITLTGPTFTLYGIKFNQGSPIEVPLCDLMPSVMLSSSAAFQYQIDPGKSVTSQLVCAQDLTLDQVQEINSYGLLKIICSNPNISYQPDPNGPTLTLSNVITNVNATTARVIVDFDNCLKGQESPLTRNVATLTKFNPSAATPGDRYGSVYLGELLHNMGLSYTFDEKGFKSINGLERDSTNLWITQIIHPKGLSGQAGDTVEVRMGKYSGPDSVVVNTGDIVYVSYSGDDNKDSVQNCVAKMYGIYEDADHVSKSYHDFDGDGISNYEEIYGWVPKGSTDTVYTDPSNSDSDGDGIPDGVDPEPLVARKAVASNLAKFSILDYKGSIIDSLNFSATDTAKAFGKVIPCIPHFYVDVDSMALWAKIVVNTDTLLLTYDSTIVSADKKTRLFRYIDAQTTVRNNLPIGNISIRVITKPLDKGTEKVWKISAISGLQCALSAPVVLQTPDNSWGQLKVQLAGAPTQTLVEPRTKGYYVFRNDIAGTVLDLTDRSTMVQVRDKVGRWMCVGVYGVSSVTDIIDTGLVENGAVTYSYRIVPYANDGPTYYYAPASAEASNKTNGLMPHTFSAITDVQVITGKTPSVPEGYTLINKDLNDGADGKYIWIVYKKETVTNTVAKSIVTDLTLLDGKDAVTPSDYTKINYDLNEGSGGDFIYLAVKYEKSTNATAFSSAISSFQNKNGTGTPDAGYTFVYWNGTTNAADVNKGAGGDFIYLEYTRSQE